MKLPDSKALKIEAVTNAENGEIRYFGDQGNEYQLERITKRHVSKSQIKLMA